MSEVIDYEDLKRQMRREEFRRKLEPFTTKVKEAGKWYWGRKDSGGVCREDNTRLSYEKRREKS